MRSGIRTLLSEPRTIIWIGVLIISLTVCVTALRVTTRARVVQMRVTSIEQMVQGEAGLDAMRLKDELTAIRLDLAEIRADVGWAFPLASWFGWVPEIGGDLAEAGDLFEMAFNLLSGADALSAGWTPVLEGGNASSPSMAERLLDPLVKNRSEFAGARAYLARAETYRARIHAERLSPSLSVWLERADRALEGLYLAVDGSIVLPDVLGKDGARSYLIVAQNEDELRATGGFVSAVGLLTIADGRLAELKFLDSYQVDDLTKDYLPPPDPLERYMRAGVWLFRDANWSPDFPTSARLLADLYETGQGVKVDGVLALDQEAARLLIRAFGTLEVDGNPPAIVNADNLIGFMRESWSPPTGVSGSTVWQARKGFIGNLAKAVQQRLNDGAPINQTALARGLYEALQRRHLAVWLRGSPFAESLKRLGWDGSIYSGSGDYVMVIDSNVGFNKANALVSQSFKYEAALTADQRARATLTVSYRHAGRKLGQECALKVPDYSANWTYGALTDLCYWNYLRAYVPKGTALKDASRYPTPGRQLLSGENSSGEPEVLTAEAGKDAFASFFYVERGGAREVSFTYETPPGVVAPQADGSWKHTLYWQKQAGVDAPPVQATIKLPQGANLIRASSHQAKATTEVKDGVVHVYYGFNLSTDAMLELVYRLN